MAADPSLVAHLSRHGQDHLLRWWDELTELERGRLAADLAAIDFDQLDHWIETLVNREVSTVPGPDEVGPIDVFRLPRTDGERVARRHVAEVGASMLAAGEVGVVVVAGGSGTRLNFPGPKGTFPIGAVSGASLFQVHAEKIVALARRHGKPIPLYVMTSPENHEATAAFFAQHHNFGLSHVRLFTQGELPAVAQASGKVLLAEKGRVALSPDGHGGTLTALAAPGPDGRPSCLEEMRDRGVRTLFYFQVDNPLVKIADPAFLGQHRQADSEMSFKVVEKQMPEEKVGVVVTVAGRPRVIEYSDLYPKLAEPAERRAPEGNLELWAGSIAIHVLEREFIERLGGGTQLPFHRALKKVSYIDESGALVEPSRENAVKFERFIFDALPLARRWAIVETDRALEFEPLKNATGPDSPATVRRRMTDRCADWLERAGATVHRASDGSVPFDIEISPLYALDSAELRSKLPPGRVIEGPTYLQ